MKIGAIALGIFTIFMLLGPFREPIIDGIKGWRTNDTLQSESVATGVGQTTANVTLDYDLYQAVTAEVQSISSNITGETPVASAYTEATKVLLVSGLDASATRTLGIQYYAETEDTTMRVLGPFLAGIGFLILVGLIIWGMFGGKRRRGW